MALCFDALLFDKPLDITNSKNNTKHYTILMLAYATGMRVSEIVNLCIHDIDSERMVIIIRNAKGKKDRQVMLSEKLLIQLRAYYKEYKPKLYLFEGIDGGSYSERSVQKIFSDAKQIARNKKAGGIHSMRHSFATHLMENVQPQFYKHTVMGSLNLPLILVFQINLHD